MNNLDVFHDLGWGDLSRYKSRNNTAIREQRAADLDKKIEELIHDTHTLIWADRVLDFAESVHQYKDIFVLSKKISQLKDLKKEATDLIVEEKTRITNKLHTIAADVDEDIMKLSITEHNLAWSQSVKSLEKKVSRLDRNVFVLLKNANLLKNMVNEADQLKIAAEYDKRIRTLMNVTIKVNQWLNPQKFSFFCVNNYPAGFNMASSSVVSDLRQLANSGSKGVISVICETTDGNYRDSTPMLTAEELHADCIEFDGNGKMLYNGTPADCYITKDNFSPRDYWETLDKYFRSASSISLESLFKSSVHIQNKFKPISIPIGKSDGAIFNLEMSECTDKMFGLIIGTTGSGKSAFLHTLILSAAYHNSPEDLQFYLADFKNSSGSTEFSHYRKDDEKANLYIPHVRYLLLKGKSESAFDLLEKIKSIHSKRASILDKYGYSQVDQYNKGEEVSSGRAKKLPIVFFVIDEYNAMLHGGTDTADSGVGSESTAIVAEIKHLISTVRSSGIGIILCGQSVDNALKNGQALGNIGCRISLPVKSDGDLVNLFDFDSSYDARKKMQLLAGQGDALVSLGRTSNLRYVRTAYSGQTNGQQQLRIAAEIRRKYALYEYTQIEAGSEESVPITEALQNESYCVAKENEVLLDMGVSSANSLRMPLVYSQTEASANFFACTNKDKLCKIERSAMFSFLRYTIEHKRIYQEAPITYLAVTSKVNECLGEYFTNQPWLSSYIHTVTTKADIAQKLISLRKIYRERKRSADRGVTAMFAPMFVVLRDIAWLNDKDADWISNASSDSVLGEDREDLIFDTDLMTNNIFNGVTNSEEIASPTKLKNANQRKESEHFTAEDVKKAVSTLYAEGNKYGIFMLVSSETYAPITNILMSQNDNKTAFLAKYGIFGSFEEATKHIIDITAPQDCAFISYFHSKIRLYDYSPIAYADWWKSLKNKLS